MSLWGLKTGFAVNAHKSKMLAHLNRKVQKNELIVKAVRLSSSVSQPFPKIFLSSNARPEDNKRKFEPRCEKTGLRGFRPGPTQTGLYSHRRWLEA